MRHWAAAGAVIAFTTLLLVEKSRIHAMVRRLDDASLRAAARFAVMAVVILPILPRGPYGPWGGIEPRTLWMLVLFFSGLNFAGYIARRAAGETRGHLLTGLLGGFISSTVVTVTSARQSQITERFLGLGVRRPGRLHGDFPPHPAGNNCAESLAGSCAGALSRYPHRLRSDCHPLQPASRPEAAGSRSDVPQNPLQFYSALKMALIFQAVFYGVYGLQHLFQEAGTLASGALVGLVEMDALVVTMARKAPEVGLDTAARAMLAGLISDAAVKIALAAFLGKGRFRWAVPAGLTCIAAAIAASLVIVHRYVM